LTFRGQRLCQATTPRAGGGVAALPAYCHDRLSAKIGPVADTLAKTVPIYHASSQWRCRSAPSVLLRQAIGKDWPSRRRTVRQDTRTPGISSAPVVSISGDMHDWRSRGRPRSRLCQATTPRAGGGVAALPAYCHDRLSPKIGPVAGARSDRTHTPGISSAPVLSLSGDVRDWRSRGRPGRPAGISRPENREALREGGLCERFGLWHEASCATPGWGRRPASHRSSGRVHRGERSRVRPTSGTSLPRHRS